MGNYTSTHDIRCWVPDGRLAHLTTHPSGLLEYRYHVRHITPGVVHDWAEIGRHIARSGILELDSPREGGPVDFEVRIERVPHEQMYYRSILIRYGLVSTGHPFMEVQTPAEQVSKELVREMNEEILPKACRQLRLVPH